MGFFRKSVHQKNQSRLKSVTPYAWESVMDIAPTSYDSTQVLHPVGKKKPYQDNPAAAKFVADHLAGAVACESDADVLRFASEHVSVPGGFYLEMGVATGRSINFIAALNPTKKIFGFDSFSGLPEEWDRGDVYHPRGAFRFKKKIVLPLLKNVIVYQGLFKDVLPVFKKNVLKDNPIAFLHVDSDIYISARDIFQEIGSNIVSGTVVVFDELYNYPYFENHEWKALQEFLAVTKTHIKFLAFNAVNEQVAIKFL